MSLTLRFKKYLSVMGISIKASSAYKIKLFFYALTVTFICGMPYTATKAAIMALQKGAFLHIL